MEKDVRLGQEISQMKRAERSHAFLIDQQTLHFYLYGTRAVRGIDVSELKRKQTEDITEYTQGLQSSKKQKVTAGHDEPRLTNAIRSFPDEVQLCMSSIPGAGYGVCAKELIPLGTWIGPYEGRHLPAQAVTPNMDTTNLWEIFKRGTLSHYIDGSDEEHSSWMRFIRCARHIREQNLFSFQYCGNIFYRAFKQIGPGTELLVWYDEKYPHCLGIPLGVQDYETMRDAANTPPKSISWISTNTSCTTNQQHSTQDSKNNDFLESWKKNGSGNFKHPTTTAVQPGLLFKQSSILNTSKQELLPSLNHNTVMTAKAGRRSKLRSFSLDNRGSPPSSTPSERASRHYIPHLLQTASIKETKLLSHQGFYHPPRQTARNYESSSDLKNPRRAVEGQTSSALNGGLFPHSGSSAVQEGNSQSITSFLAHHHQTTSQVANQEQAIKRYQTESKLEIPHSSHLTHHMPPPLTTDFNPRYSQAFELQTPGLDSDEFGMWRCRQCLKTFTQRVLLQLHICPETPRKPYQCGHCTLSFATPSDLRNHVETHTNDKPFKCGFCSRSFSGATTLNNHIRTHTGEKPFNCDNCMRTFSQASRLARHQRDCPPLDSSTCFYQFTPKKA